MREGIPVVRPLRRSEYHVFFVSKSVEKAWIDLLATNRDKTVTAWETLTTKPCQKSEFNYQLKQDLGAITKAGETYDLWQLKLDKSDGARVWYFMANGRVYIEEVFTAHPNATK